jgi:hypothetical protein
MRVVTIGRSPARRSAGRIPAGYAGPRTAARRMPGLSHKPCPSPAATCLVRPAFHRSWSTSSCLALASASTASTPSPFNWAGAV